jgi:nucleotide sugar dehydrogenase
VVGLEQDTPSGREKAARLNRGEPPVYASDDSLGAVIAKASRQSANVLGTVVPTVLRQADVVIFCINLDLDRTPGQTEQLFVDVDGYRRAMRMVGQYVPPGCLVTVESTLPVGMCDTVLYPALRDGQRDQGLDPEANPPLLAYCYERVMPGPEYLDSVNHFWRSYAGINAESARRAREFLSKFVDTRHYPLWEHKHTRAAEMAKLLENAYRATNIAFVEEWARLAEDIGVDLFDVIDSIKVRKGTHDNIRYPGLGVGGYCLTKDALLAAFGAESLLHRDAALPFSRNAILTNEKMPLRATEWIRSHFAGALAGKNALLLGATYRPGVADTRSSPSEIVVRSLRAERVAVTVYDRLMSRWDELPDIVMETDPNALSGPRDIVVICLPDKEYEGFLPELLIRDVVSGGIVVDPWNMVGDATAAALAARGVRTRVYGRGDVITSATPLPV